MSKIEKNKFSFKSKIDLLCNTKHNRFNTYIQCHISFSRHSFTTHVSIILISYYLFISATFVSIKIVIRRVIARKFIRLTNKRVVNFNSELKDYLASFTAIDTDFCCNSPICRTLVWGRSGPGRESRVRFKCLLM